MSAGVFAQDHSIELVVWPETPVRITCEDDSGIRHQLTAIAARYGVPFLINCVQAAPGGGDFNTELLLDSRRTYAYHKQRLFPFTEYIPGERWFPGLRALIPGVSRYTEGRDATVFRIKGPLGVFPAICYEALFPGHVRQFVGQGGNILISAANDAWFGRSRIPEFAIAESVYQAVQFRIPVVRVSNSGDSLAVKASGIIVPESRTAAFTKTTRVVEVFAPRTRSPYLTLGNLFLYVLAAGWLIAVLRDLRKARARGGATGGPQP
jgi:apolipoprotein N-acyltransferase